MVKEIPLQNGMVALVDDEDFERVNQYVWTVAIVGETTFQVVSGIENKIIILGRFVMGAKVEEKVLQKNKNNLDCRKENLTLGTSKDVLTHARGHRNSSSKYKGVFWSKSRNKWVAQIRVGGIRKHLGYFTDEDEAAKVYNENTLKYHGQYAYQNVIGENNNAIGLEKENVRQIRRKKQNKTGYRNVYARPSGNFQTYLRANGKREFIGTFETAEQAAKAYDLKAYELYGDKAILNFPELIEEYRSINKVVVK